jgi:hypothetical protein
MPGTSSRIRIARTPTDPQGGGVPTSGQDSPARVSACVNPSTPTGQTLQPQRTCLRPQPSACGEAGHPGHGPGHRETSLQKAADRLARAVNPENAIFPQASDQVAVCPAAPHVQSDAQRSLYTLESKCMCVIAQMNPFELDMHQSSGPGSLQPLRSIREWF